MNDELKFDLKGFEDQLASALRRGREAFQGIYKKELDELSGLSRREIDEITPDITDLQKYDELVTVVKEASRGNLAQAQLKRQIENLGEVAVKIARRVPSLEKILRA
jgi:hypothetical protein